MIVAHERKDDSSSIFVRRAQTYAHVNTNTVLPLINLVLIRENKSWLLTKKGLIAFKFTLSTA